MRKKNSKRTEWKSLGVSLRGSSHEKAGMPCQDAHHLLTEDGEWLIVAVSDGAGSAKYSQLGSQAATVSACHTMARYLKESGIPPNESTWKEIIQKVMETTLGVIILKAEELGHDKRDLACTMILVALGPRITVAGQIGDGAVIIQDDQGIVKNLTKPVHGNNINETTFMVSPGALGSIQFVFDDGGCSHIAVFTDGIQMISLKYPTWEPKFAFFAPLFKFIGEEKNSDEAKVKLTTFLTGDTIRQKCDDDITLVLAKKILKDAPLDPDDDLMKPREARADDLVDGQSILVQATSAMTSFLNRVLKLK